MLFRSYRQLIKKAEIEIFNRKLKEIQKIHNIRKNTLKIKIKYTEDYYLCEENDRSYEKDFTSKKDVIAHLHEIYHNYTMTIHFHYMDNFQKNMAEKTPRYIIVSIKNEITEYSI